MQAGVSACDLSFLDMHDLLPLKKKSIYIYVYSTVGYLSLFLYLFVLFSFFFFFFLCYLQTDCPSEEGYVRFSTSDAAQQHFLGV